MTTAQPADAFGPPTIGKPDLSAAARPDGMGTAAPGAVAGKTNSAPGDSPLPPGKILVVDDEPVNVRVVKRYLTSAGYTRVLTATDATEVMNLIEKERPDLVLLDVMMPEVSGTEILQRLRSHPRLKYLPVLILTANTDPQLKQTCLELGATDFLHKPVDPLDLLPRVRNTLVTKSFQDQLARYAQQLESRVRERTRELEASRREVVYCLARAAEYRDSETGNHVLRVGRFAGVIARQLGFSEEAVDSIEMAAQLHDVGKIAIPDAILHKPGQLDPDEFAYMRRHSAIGHAIIQPLQARDVQRLRQHVIAGGQLLALQGSPLLRLAATIALSHHERWDGSGYPLGLAGEDIPIEARMTSVADVFDALSSARPYKAPIPRQRCFEILEDGRGTQFDPKVLDAFMAGADEVIRIQRELVDMPG